jgi:hypothetical protein
MAATDGQHKASVTIDARVDAADREIKKLTGTVNKLEAALARSAAAGNKFDAALAKATAGQRQQEDLAKRFGQTDSALKGLGASLGKAGAAFGIVTFGAIQLASAIEQVSAESLKTQAVFKNLAFSIEPARRATHGLVGDMDLATQANRLVALGVVSNSQEFAKLAAAAQALGQKLGTTTESAFESLTAAVGRGSSMMLDNLGIVVKQEQAHKLYAASLGKAVEKLSDAEKAEAFRKVALEAIFKAADEVTVVTDGAAAATQRYRVELDNLKTSALGGHDRVTTLQEGLRQLTQSERDGVQEGRIYGAVIEDMERKLHTLGVQYADMPKSVDGWIAASERASKSLRTQALDAQIAARSVGSLQAQLQAVRGARKADDNLNRMGERAGVLRDLEERIASGKGSERETNGLLLQQATLRAEILEETGKHEEAIDLVRNAELNAMRATSGHASAVKELTAEQKKFNAQLELAHKAGPAIKGAPTLESATAGVQFESAANEAHNAEVGGQMQRGPSAAEQEMQAQSRLAEQLRGLEMQRAQGSITELQRIESEKQARLSHLTTLESLVAGEQYVDERRQVMHEAEMARIQEEKDGNEQRMKMVQTGIDLAGQAANSLITGLVATSDARRAAITQAKLQGKTEKEAAKAGEIAALQQQASNLMSIRNQLIGIAIAQGVMALAAAASFNFPGAALHAAAAIAAGAGAAAVGAMARSKSAAAASAQMSVASASSGSTGSSSRGSSGGSSERSGDMPGSSSPIPGSPNPQAPTSGGNQGGHGGGNVYNISGNFYGTPKKDFIRQVTEGQRHQGYEREPRRTG